MSTLADELMNDLEGDSGSDEGGGYSDPDRQNPSQVMAANSIANKLEPGDNDDDDDDDDDAAMREVNDGLAEGQVMVPEGGVQPTLELDPSVVDEMKLETVEDVNTVAKLAKGKTMANVLKGIEHYRANPDPHLATDADSEEYKLIVQANNLSVEIDNEMLIVHKFIRDHYTPRFPELDSLVSAPLPFCRVILALGNDPGSLHRAGKSDVLQGLLTSGAVMAVTVTAATSKGQQLSDSEWRVVTGACDMMFQLDQAKTQILEYVESRISLLAPNISAIVGTQTATKILGIAGGLAGLTRIPHSNIYVLGALKRASTGFSTASHSVDRLHTGFIYHCPLVQQTRPEDRMKAQRKVGAKVALAARVDSAGSHPDGQFGEEMVDKLEREFERLARPAPKKVVKALPRPDEQKKKRRGGKRARKAKEAYAMTELRKLQNRMAFGEAEEETGAYDETRGMGMIGNSTSGRVRANAGEAKSKAKLSKMSKGRLASLRGLPASSALSGSASGSATSGLASSLAFTPVQGLELIDPSKMRNKVDAANAKWFADDGAFTHVKKGGGIGKPQPPPTK